MIILIKNMDLLIKRLITLHSMAIVSISLNKEILEEIDKLKSLLGFSGRSEIIRAGIRNLLAEEKEKQDLIGLLHALLLIIHDEKSDDQVTEMRHDYDKLINTHLHSKIDRDRCLEIFLIKGNANDIREMTKKFQTNKKMDHIKLIAM
ncbi:MAG TPA: CopG family ribbon-helix-helix protein [Nitrososphaeraceae archaeon]|jgi:CopG family nickel-responsive transcriptional regulator|nr:CopG family ribbon-helix-helix protein [Nitrososphaeraceae archaeon]